MRKLAERSQNAAAEIGELSKSTVDMAGRAGDTLDALVPDIRRTAELVQEISAASAEQSSGIEQITKAASRLHTVTQRNTNASDDIARMAEELSAQAAELKDTLRVAVEEDGSLTISGNPGTDPAETQTPLAATLAATTL